MFIDKDRKGLVRGYVTLQQDHGSYEPITAYTFWYRHDEPDLENKLQKALNGIVHYYFSQHNKCGGATVGTEWMDYKH